MKNTYQATYDKNGEYNGFYIKEIHENIPQNTIDLSEEQWQQALTKNYKVIEGRHTYSPFIQHQEDFLESLRATRNSLLTNSDWTQVEDAPLCQEKKTEWKNYRQELRDITDLDDLKVFAWPTSPV